MNGPAYDRDSERWFEFESRTGSHMVIGALATVRGRVPTRAEVLLLMEVVRAGNPRLRSHARPPGRPALPVPALTDHLVVSRLDPTGQHALDRAVEQACAQPLGDLTWQVRLFHGHREDGFAIALLAHHGLLDGLSMTALFRTAAVGAALRSPVPPYGAGRSDSAFSRVRTMTCEAAAVLAPRRAAAQPVRDTADPDGPPRRRWARVPLSRLTAIAHAYTASPNDVYVAALAGALARFQPEGEGPVRVLVPVSSRSAAERDRLGNFLYGRAVTVAPDLATARARLASVMEQTRRIRADQRVAESGALLRALPATWQARVTSRQLDPRRVTCLASYVAAAALPLPLAGLTVEQVRPLMFLPAGHRLAVCLAEYAGSATVEVVALPGVPAAGILTAWLDELGLLERGRP